MRDATIRQIDLSTVSTLERLSSSLSEAAHSARWPPDGLLPPGQWLRPYHRRILEPMAVSPDSGPRARALVQEIRAALREIARERGYMWEDRAEEQKVGRSSSAGEQWNLGEVVYMLEERPFLRGSVEMRRSEPIAQDVPEVLVEFLMAVPGFDAQITRETHGRQWGYHYHYLDGRDRRSDTLLTFDRDSDNSRPTLCWERHAEGDKFKARAEDWGGPKRESVYSVCHPDTLRFALTDFKRPKAGAGVVWPLPTARHALPIAQPKRPALGRSRRPGG
jgi:hypothetical protein